MDLPLLPELEKLFKHRALRSGEQQGLVFLCCYNITLNVFAFMPQEREELRNAIIGRFGRLHPVRNT
ncbi:hypothetical protein [Pseudomonas violetae]|uniref:Uncharacterized protein n=1 Tax=Pseudomonas violetae TaxID=2915813 RepID=A0ABT0EWA4_9PSED|nr:hypothetical protein [Pseudomonas violetae]MCK1790025.1 hypothetical protein [Pseudomonas violetae]